MRDGHSSALALEGIAVRYGEAQILHGVDLLLAEGEIHALIGPNGAGKSTLFNVVSGLARPTAGKVRLHGRDITGWPAHRIARQGLSRSFQVANVFPSLSVFDNLRCAAMRSCGLGYAWWRGLAGAGPLAERARRVTAEIGLAGRADVPAGELSYAEQRALELGMALATDARVLLLDEPTAGMSRAESARMADLIRASRAGRAVLVVEHDMQVVFALADRVSVMVDGRIAASDAPARIGSHAAAREAYLGQVSAARGSDGP